MTRTFQRPQLLADLNISQTTTVQIMKELSMRRFSSSWVPHCLTKEQMRKWIKVCGEWLRMMNSDSDLMTKTVTGDENWVQHFDPLLKQESATWKLPGQVRKIKVRQQRSPMKVMLTAFFDSEGLLYQNFAAPNSTVTNVMYQGVLCNLWYHIGRKQPHLREIWLFAFGR